MSNVPAYPKNPLLVHEVSQHETGAVSRSEEKSATEKNPLKLEEIAGPFRLQTFTTLVEREPIRAVLVAAGIGLVAGAMVRR